MFMSIRAAHSTAGDDRRWPVMHWHRAFSQTHSVSFPFSFCSPRPTVALTGCDQ